MPLSAGPGPFRSSVERLLSAQRSHSISGAKVCWPSRADPRYEHQFRSHPLPAGSAPESEDRRGWCHAGCQKIIAALPRRYIGAHHPGRGYLGTPEHFTRSGVPSAHRNTSPGRRRCAGTSEQITRSALRSYIGTTRSALRQYIGTHRPVGGAPVHQYITPVSGVPVIPKHHCGWLPPSCRTSSRLVSCWYLKITLGTRNQ